MTLYKKSTRHASRQAFTLMEILIVVAIIVILAGIGTVALFPQLNKAKENEARIKAAQIAKAVGIYMTDHDGTPPPSLQALLTPDSVGGPWINTPDGSGILDPWGKQYQMDPSGPKHNGGEPDVWTTSPSGKTLGNFKTGN